MNPTGAPWLILASWLLDTRFLAVLGLRWLWAVCWGWLAAAGWLVAGCYCHCHVQRTKLVQPKPSQAKIQILTPCNFGSPHPSPTSKNASSAVSTFC